MVPLLGNCQTEQFSKGQLTIRWRRGSVQEVAWLSGGKHAGGYSYRCSQIIFFLKVLTNNILSTAAQSLIITAAIISPKILLWHCSVCVSLFCRNCKSPDCAHWASQASALSTRSASSGCLWKYENICFPITITLSLESIYFPMTITRRHCRLTI